jgi:pimeloyl-ACP methyl ester carboxylesterase
MIGWSRGSFQRDGVDLHYVRTGGSKPPFVLLHGLTASGACWTPLARALEDRFDVVMPDARGHGSSSAPLHGYRYEEHAMDVIALIQHLGLEAPVLLGHSMGGMTAALVANRMTHDIRGVVLVDPTFLSPQRQRDVFESGVADQHRRTLSLDKTAVVAEIQARHPHRSPEIVDLLAQARLQTRISAFDVLTPPNPDYEQLVREIQVPILLIIADGGVVSLDTARRLQTLNPGVRIERIADAGHGIPFDRPERFEAAIRSCLGWISSPG